MKARSVWSQLYMFQRVYRITCQCHCTCGPRTMLLQKVTMSCKWQDSNICTKDKWHISIHTITKRFCAVCHDACALKKRRSSELKNGNRRTRLFFVTRLVSSSLHMFEWSSLAYLLQWLSKKRHNPCNVGVFSVGLCQPIFHWWSISGSRQILFVLISS